MKYIVILLLVISSHPTFAQNHKGLIKNDNHLRRKVPSQYVREADVMWSKTIWRLIDMKQKFNSHLYFPTQPVGKYSSLSDVLLSLVKNNGVNIYDENQGDEFGLQITNKDIFQRMGGGVETITIDGIYASEDQTKEIKIPIETSDITRYLLKEVWFFDKSRSQMEVRIVGICPIREYYHDEDFDQEDIKYKKIGWFYFPEIAQHLANSPAMNGGNQAWTWTYYDVFQNRYFESIIVQEGNIYNNRPISDYAMGKEALLESKRIENAIRNFESDLWNQ